MNIRTDIRSPNFFEIVIPIEFLVLHYTAGDFQRACDIFTDPARKVSCHLLIAEDGQVFELVPCLTAPPLQAAHAGVSQWESNGKVWESFNQFSLGIELVNPNGNVLDYTDQQYVALTALMSELKQRFPSLRDPNRIVGHEHIAGSRGKSDPGYCFSWGRFFGEAYPDVEAPPRLPICPETLRKALVKFLDVCPSDRDLGVKFWHALSAVTEACVALLHQKKPSIQ
jgi:N-acetyl-anhydromuramyl-L-alanine amidase AmpD